MTEFNVRLKELREAKGLSQTDLAKMFDVTPSTIYLWEKGKTEPSIARLRKLGQIFDCSLHFLLGMTDDPQIEKKDLITDEGNKAVVVYDRTRFDDDEQLKRAVSAMVKQAMEEQSRGSK